MARAHDAPTTRRRRAHDAPTTLAAQVDGSDRVLCVNSNSDVQFDEEFYKFLCKTYGEALRERIFFFIDNRNVIGKDVPFQLVYQRRFGQPLFMQSVVLAHDVDDFSKIWQAMGRSRTMNETRFSIYKSGVPEDAVAGEGAGVRDIKAQRFTQRLYERNCDCKMAGNLSSIYQTLVSLFNLSQGRFYFCDEMVNTFLEKMDGAPGGELGGVPRRGGDSHLALLVTRHHRRQAGSPRGAARAEGARRAGARAGAGAHPC